MEHNNKINSCYSLYCSFVRLKDFEIIIFLNEALKYLLRKMEYTIFNNSSKLK